MNYGDIIEYIDRTLDENFNEARKWAEQHNTTFEELIDRRDLPKRYFQIGEEPVPTEEEQRQKREQAYTKEVDPITCHIQRLEDEEQTPEVEQEISDLKKERSAKVEEIKERYPYPEES